MYDNVQTKEQLALATYVKLVRAAESITAATHGELTEKALTISQFGILEALYHLGPLCQKELAQKILKSSGNVTLVIDNLRKQGLVVRKRSVEDRRYYVIDLTPAGRTLIADYFPIHKQKIASALSSLSLEEQQQLGALLKKLKPQS